MGGRKLYRHETGGHRLLRQQLRRLTSIRSGRILSRLYLFDQNKCHYRTHGRQHGGQLRCCIRLLVEQNRQGGYPDASQFVRRIRYRCRIGLHLHPVATDRSFEHRHQCGVACKQRYHGELGHHRKQPKRQRGGAVALCRAEHPPQRFNHHRQRQHDPCGERQHVERRGGCLSPHRPCSNHHGNRHRHQCRHGQRIDGSSAGHRQNLLHKWRHHPQQHHSRADQRGQQRRNGWFRHHPQRSTERNG